MSRFKIGDRVVRTEKRNAYGCDGKAVEVGELCTVAGVDRGWLLLKEHPSMSYGNNPVFFRLARYSEYFTEPAKAESTTGHAEGSPIQKHSKGEFYPLCVVGYSDAGRTAFTIENLETGEVLSFMPYEFKGGANIRAWGTAHGAYKFLAEHQQDLKASSWIKGRPTFIKHSLGLEVVVLPKHKRWAVVLDKVDLNKDTMLLNGVYYQALEQDIG